MGVSKSDRNEATFPNICYQPEAYRTHQTFNVHSAPNSHSGEPNHTFLNIQVCQGTIREVHKVIEFHLTQYDSGVALTKIIIVQGELFINLLISGLAGQNTK